MSDVTAPGSDVGRYSDVVYHFGPHETTMPNVREYLAALWERRVFIDWLARTDLRGERSTTSLGNVWGVLDPLFQAAIYYFLYTVLRGGARAAFLPVLVLDVFLFQLSASAMTDGGNSVKRARSLMLKSTFPRALLPITAVYKQLLGFGPSLVVMAVFFPLSGGDIGPGLFSLPLLFAIQTVMNVGIALLMSAAVVLITDTGKLLRYLNRVLFFATPVIYPIGLLPPNIKPLLAWQPLFGLFESYQAVFTGRMPPVGSVLLAAVWAVVLVIVGGRLFLRHEREFAMHL